MLQKIFLILIPLFFFACETDDLTPSLLAKTEGNLYKAKPRTPEEEARIDYKPYVLSHIPSVKELEKQDHHFCTSLQLNWDKRESSESSFYWRCRLQIAKDRLNPDELSSQENYEYNREISDLIGKIYLELVETSELTLMRENKRTDKQDHQQCLKQGFALKTDDSAAIDDYFSCRKNLIETRNRNAPFEDNDLLLYPNASYNLGYVLDRKIDKDLKMYKDVKAEYPQCNFNIHSNNFANCKKAQDESRQCFVDAKETKIKKDIEEKLRCQKQTYARFSDRLLKKDNLTELEIARMNAQSDYSTQSSFAAIGISESQFSTMVSQDKPLDREAEKRRTAKDINSEKELYSRLELTKLRQKYAQTCQKDAERNLKKFYEKLDFSCAEKAKFKLESDD